MEQIFLSYSRRDNETFQDDSVGWVSSFRRALEVEMKHVSHPCKVWMDIRDLPGDVPFDDELRERLDDSDALVLIHSSNWMESQYCNLELNHFLQGNEREVDGRQGLFLTRMAYVDFDSGPTVLRKLNGYRFHDETNGENPLLALPLTVTDGPESEFRRTLRRLALDISSYLEKRANKRAGVSEPAVITVTAEPQSDRQRCILLARATPDLLPYADKLSRELTQKGYEVLEPTRYRKGLNEIENEWKQLLAQASATIHLVGAVTDPVLNDPAHTLVKLQFDLSADLGDRLRMTWIAPQALQPGSAGLAVAQDIRNAPREQGDRLYEGIECDATVEILEALQSRKPQGEGHKIYLVYSREDQDAALRLAKYLLDKQIDFEPSLHDGDPEALISDHYEKLQKSQGVLVYWGHSRDSWFARKVVELQQWVLPREDIKARIGLLGKPDATQKEILKMKYRGVFDVLFNEDPATAFTPLDEFLSKNWVRS